MSIPANPPFMPSPPPFSLSSLSHHRRRKYFRPNTALMRTPHGSSQSNIRAPLYLSTSPLAQLTLSPLSPETDSRTPPAQITNVDTIICHHIVSPTSPCLSLFCHRPTSLPLLMLTGPSYTNPPGYLFQAMELCYTHLHPQTYKPASAHEQAH